MIVVLLAVIAIGVLLMSEDGKAFLNSTVNICSGIVAILILLGVIGIAIALAVWAFETIEHPSDVAWQNAIAKWVFGMTIIGIGSAAYSIFNLMWAKLRIRYPRTTKALEGTNDHMMFAISSGMVGILFGGISAVLAAFLVKTVLQAAVIGIITGLVFFTVIFQAQKRWLEKKKRKADNKVLGNL